MSVNYLIFYIGKTQFCMPAERVVEVNRHCEHTAVPGAHEAIKGIINLRGQLIVAFDMSTLLNIESEPGLRNSISILVKVDTSTISLLVDRVGDILVLDESTFEEPPNNFSLHMHSGVLGAHKLSDNLLIVIDPTVFIAQSALPNSINELAITNH